jgi:hypothetical protein
MSQPKIEEIRAFVQERFASAAGLTKAELMAEDLTLSDVILRAPSLVNSVDLMECFARTSNAVQKQYGVRVRLPAHAPSATINAILNAFIGQVEREFQKASATPC